MKSSKNSMFEILDNTEGLYEGDLWYYFNIIFQAPNIINPYHNFRHLMYVLCAVYEGGKFMNYHKLFGRRNFRALLIAAMFHDYDHDGKMGNDEVEIDRAIMNVKKHLLPSDYDLIYIICNFIRATQFPHVECEQNMGTDIIRDADISQLFDDEWIQQIIFGLSREMNISPFKMLEVQLSFIHNITFKTQWAKESFLHLVEVRIAETQQLLTNLSY